METEFEKLTRVTESFKVQPEAVPFHHHDSAGCSGNAKSCRGGVYTVFVITLEPSQPTQYSLTRYQLHGRIHNVSLYAELTSLILMHLSIPLDAVIGII